MTSRLKSAAGVPVCASGKMIKRSEASRALFEGLSMVVLSSGRIVPL
jgi:hypothetical protein